MLLLTDTQSTFRMIVTVIAAANRVSPKNLTIPVDLKRAYREFLRSHNQIPYDLSQSQPSFKQTSNRAECMSSKFSGMTGLDDLEQGSILVDQVPMDFQKIELQLREAIQHLQELSQEHSALLELLITDFYLHPASRARAGSTCSLQGCIWIENIEKYSKYEVTEILLHELTHNAVFMDELHYKHYDYDVISQSHCLAVSTILNRERPLDKVLHSILVATELILFRKKFTPEANHGNRIHAPTAQLLNQAVASIRSLEQALRAFPTALSERGIFLVRTAADRLGIS